MDNGQSKMDGGAHPLAINESVSAVQCFESLRQEFVVAWSDESAAIADGNFQQYHQGGSMLLSKSLLTCLMG